MFICQFTSFGQHQGGFKSRKAADAYGKASGFEYRIWSRADWINR